MLQLYTDVYTEATGSDGRQLGEDGLLKLTEPIPRSTSFDQIGRELLSAFCAYSNGISSDDVTLIVIQFGHGRRSAGIMERLRG